MNLKDYGVTAAEEYITALIAVVSLFRIHCHMARTVLEISHSLSNQVRISFNLANFAWLPPGDLPDSLLHHLHRCLTHPPSRYQTHRQAQSQDIGEVVSDSNHQP